MNEVYGYCRNTVAPDMYDYTYIQVIHVILL